MCSHDDNDDSKLRIAMLRMNLHDDDGDDDEEEEEVWNKMRTV